MRHHGMSEECHYRKWTASFDHLVGGEKQLRRHFEPECLRLPRMNKNDLKEIRGIVELNYYYRPAGFPREKQPWLASVWRR